MNPGKRDWRCDPITIHDQINNIKMKLTFIFSPLLLTGL